MNNKKLTTKYYKIPLTCWDPNSDHGTLDADMSSLPCLSDSTAIPEQESDIKNNLCIKKYSYLQIHMHTHICKSTHLHTLKHDLSGTYICTLTDINQFYL